MNRTEKTELIERLKAELGETQAVFVTDYKGLSVAEISQLRGGLKVVGGKYQVVKNTLLKRAVEGTPATGLEPLLQGPTAIAMALKDPVALAKVLVDFAKKNEKLVIQGGVLGVQILSFQDIRDLATMPGRGVLLARLLGCMNAPVANFVGVCAAIMRQLLYVLKAIEEKKNQGLGEGENNECYP